MTQHGPLRRTDRLHQLYGLLLTAVVFSGLLGALDVIALLTGQPIETRAASGAVLESDALAAVGTGVTRGAGIDLRIEHPSGVQLALAAIAALPSRALTITMLVLLSRLVGAARHTNPFTTVTARRLRTLGWLLIAGGPAASATGYAARFALSGTATTGGASASLDLGAPALWIVAGVGLLALSEVTRRGQEHRAELGTVA